MKNELSPRGQIGNYRRKVALSGRIYQAEQRIAGFYNLFVLNEYFFNPPGSLWQDCYCPEKW